MKKGEVYYWWEAQSWMVPVEISLIDGSAIASGHCKITNLGTVKNVWVDFDKLK